MKKNYLFNQFKNVESWGKSMINTLLDRIAPIEAWIAERIYTRYWISEISQKVVSKWQKNQGVLSKIDHNWFNTSLTAFLFIFVPQILVITLLNPIRCQPPTQCGWVDINMQTALGLAWQVTAAIIGIAFVIIVFLVQYVNEREFERRAFPIFMAETQMLFTVSFGLFTVLSMGIGIILLSIDSNFPTVLLQMIYYWQVFLFIVNICLTVRIFSRTIGILSPEHFRDKFLLYNRRQVKKFVVLELAERVAYKFLNDEMKSIGVDFPYIEPNYPGGKSLVELANLPREISRVYDINLRMVNHAVNRAKRLYPTLKPSDFVFYAKINHRIGREKPGIALLHPEINRPQITSYLSRSVRFGPIKDSGKEKLLSQILLNRDLILKAIQNLESDVISELLGNYEDLMKAFLDAMESFGMHFSLNEAQNEIRLFSDWELISAIEDQYSNLLLPVFKTNDPEIIKEYLKFPLRIMGLAITHRDHLLYKRFSNTFPRIYYQSRQIEDVKLREKVIESSSHRLIDHHRFNLLPRLKGLTLRNEDLNDFKDYLVQLYIVWNSLLKGALDDKNYNSFASFALAARKISKEFFGDLRDMDLEILEMQRGLVTDLNEVQRIDNEIYQKRIILSHKNEILQTQKTMFFGLGGWILHLFENNKISLEDIDKCINVIQIDHLDLNEFYLFYSNLKDLDRSEQMFNWISWEINEWNTPYGEVRSGSLTYRTILDRYYLLRSFELLPANNHDCPKLSSNTFSQTMYELVKNELPKLTESEKWISLFQRSMQGSIEEKSARLLEVHRMAAAIQGEREELEIIETPLDTELVSQFEIDINNEWDRTGVIRSVVKSFGRYNPRKYQEVDEPSSAFGIKNFSAKGAFIRQDKVAYIDWGESYGRSLAQIEDGILAAQLSSSQEIACEEQSLIQTLSAYIQDFRSKDLNPFIFFEGFEISRQFNHSSEFTPSWRLKSTPFESLMLSGMLNQSPVLSLDSLEENTLILIDINAFGVLSQYKVPNSRTFPLDISVLDLTLDQALEIYAQEPSWRIDLETGNQLNQEETLRKIRQHVIVNVWEYCQFEQINLSATIKFKVSKVEN